MCLTESTPWFISLGNHIFSLSMQCWSYFQSEHAVLIICSVWACSVVYLTWWSYFQPEHAVLIIFSVWACSVDHIFSLSMQCWSYVQSEHAVLYISLGDLIFSLSMQCSVNHIFSLRMQCWSYFQPEHAVLIIFSVWACSIVWRWGRPWAAASRYYSGPAAGLHSPTSTRYVWFKYDLDRSTMHAKFDPTEVWTHDLQIMTAPFMSLTCSPSLTNNHWTIRDFKFEGKKLRERDVAVRISIYTVLLVLRL